MAKQTINIGSAPNDGTGDTLRDAMDITNDNFTDIYNIHGWGNYADAATTPATQTISTTASKLQIDGAGTLSNSAYLPREIRGISELWDTTNDKIIAISVGDTYDVRINLEILSKGGGTAPKVLGIIPDIGGGVGVTIPIPGAIETLETAAFPYTLPVYIKLFSLATFIANGCQIFLVTDAGTLTIGKRIIFIERTYKGDPT